MSPDDLLVSDAVSSRAELSRLVKGFDIAMDLGELMDGEPIWSDLAPNVAESRCTDATEPRSTRDGIVLPVPWKRSAARRPIGMPADRFLDWNKALDSSRSRASISGRLQKSKSGMTGSVWVGSLCSSSSSSSPLSSSIMRRLLSSSVANGEPALCFCFCGSWWLSYLFRLVNFILEDDDDDIWAGPRMECAEEAAVEEDAMVAVDVGVVVADEFAVEEEEDDEAAADGRERGRRVFMLMTDLRLYFDFFGLRVLCSTMSRQWRGEPG
jgi:hypothetical protein